MALRIVAIVLVAAMAVGSLFYVFMGSAPNGVASDSEDSPVAFDLPEGHPGQEEGGKPIKLNLESIPEVVAEVGGEPIKKDEYVRALKEFHKTIEEAGNPISQERFDEIRGMILDNFINSIVLERQAKKEGVTVDEAEVDKNIEMIKKNFPDETAFENTMKEKGVTEEDIRQDIRKNLTIQALLRKNVVGKVELSPEKVREYYDLNKLQFERGESVHASHILVRFNSAAGEEEKENARKKAAEILRRVKGGEDFATVAQNESDDPGSASRGGDLGFFERGRMVPEFEKAAFETEPGKISELVESRFGFHIIKVLEKREAGVVPFEEARKGVEQKLKRELTEKEIRAYVDKLREEMGVKKLI